MEEESGTKAENGQIIVQVDGAKGKTFPVEVKPFPEGCPVAHVETTLSITKNLDNYESLRVSVSVRRPCADHDEAREATAHKSTLEAVKYIKQIVDGSAKFLPSMGIK